MAVNVGVVAIILVQAKKAALSHNNFCRDQWLEKRIKGDIVSTLELKIPPLLLTIICAALMGFVALVTPEFPVLDGVSGILSTTFLLAGALFAVLGVLAFSKADTTVNPTRPEASSVLVTWGVYRYTRNPMYVGFLFMLVGWGLYLSNAYALVFTAGFVGYMNRFQIQPEEKALESIFGAEFLAYKNRVRRWL